MPFRPQKPAPPRSSTESDPDLLPPKFDELRVPFLTDHLKGDNTDAPKAVARPIEEVPPDARDSNVDSLLKMREAMREQLTAINVRKALLESRQLFRPWRDAKWLLDEIISRGTDLSPVVVTGSSSFEFEKGANMEAACHVLGQLLRMAPRVALITGGMSGVGQTIGRAFFEQQPEGAQLLHVLPVKCGVADPKEGDTFRLGPNFPERQLILGMSAKINCMIGGGPGTIREANATLASGGIVLPIGCTAGAAAGLTFDLPDPMECSFDMNLARARAVESGFMSAAEWDRLNNSENSPEDAAQIIFSALSGC
jgi:hypothetical protein